MRRVIRLLFFVLILIFSKESFALKCVDATTNNASLTERVNEKIAVARELPVGAVIWRSSQKSLRVKCWQSEVYGAESAYLYLNPTDQNLIAMGPEFELGMNIDGRDVRCSETNKDGGWCRLKLKDMDFPGCNNLSGCASQLNNSTDIAIHYFLVKKATGQSGGGELVLPSMHISFRVAGQDGQYQGIATSSYTGLLFGLNLFVYTGCPSTVDVQPRSIDFGGFSSRSAQQGAMITERPFSIRLSKTCPDPYGVTGSLRAVSGALTANKDTLVPGNNASVGIQVLDKDTRTVLPFEKEFRLVPQGNTSLEYTSHFIARLYWMSDQAIIGAFNASAKLEVYYK